jgi:hypothetical protein
MPGRPPEREVYPAHHRSMITAYADHLGLVRLITHDVPQAPDIDAGTVVLGLLWDPMSGRRPLYRFEECLAPQDTALLFGTVLPPCLDR